MQNGDTLIGGLFSGAGYCPLAWFVQFLLYFHSWNFGSYGFWYSVVDLNQNGGLGQWFKKMFR
ncbi:MAG: hypothetical protein IPI23_15755 [Bacteroidetes bacterium]|nr:hypothetical protein [Bacteroidota bacterium]